MSIIRGRSPAPHANVPEWVGLAEISPQALALYIKLGILAERMDRFPGPDTLQKITGGATAEDVHAALDELVELGAVGIDPADGARIIESEPPADYAGPISLEGWLSLHFPEPAPPPAPTPQQRRRGKGDARRVALYRQYDAGGELLYVGISVGPGGRFDSHSSSAVWWPFAHHATWEWHPDRAAAEVAEVGAIVSELPLFNREHAVPGTAERATEYLAGRGV